MGERGEGFMPQDQRLHGSGNVALWLLTLTGILVAMGLRDFLKPPLPGIMDEAMAKRWDLNDPKSAHTRAYGTVIKNIADAALQQEAIQAMYSGEDLPSFLDRISKLQRSRDEIVSDLERLQWDSTDTIESFFKRGQKFFNELQAADPGALSDANYVSQMSRKLPSAYTPQIAQVLSWKKTDIQEAVAAFRKWEAHLRLGKNEKAASSSSDGAGPSTAPSPSPKESKSEPVDKLAVAMAAFEKVVRQSMNRFKSLSSTRNGGVNKRGRGRGRHSYGAGCNARREHKHCDICGSPDHLWRSCPHNHGGGGAAGGGGGGGAARQPHPVQHAGNGGGGGSGHHGGRTHQHQHQHDALMYCVLSLIPVFHITNHPESLALIASNPQAFSGLSGNEFLLDSAATSHICNNASYFLQYALLPPDRNDSVMTGAGPLRVEGYGTLQVKDEQGNTLLLEQVMHVPSCPVCLLSTAQLNNLGASFCTNSTAATITPYMGQALHTYSKYNGIYFLTAVPPPHEMHATGTLSQAGDGDEASYEIWHVRLGHAGSSSISKLVKGHLVEGLQLRGGVVSACKCIACELGKFRKSPYPNQTMPLKPLELISTDIAGPLPAGLNRHQYFVTVRDRCTGYTLVNTLQEKSAAGAFIQQCITSLERKTTHKVQSIRLDKAGENTSSALTTWLKDKGIAIQFTSTECHQSNGSSERVNLTIMDRVRSTLIHTNQPRLLWPWVVQHVTTAINYLPYTGTGITPHEALFGVKPDVSYLKAFGARVLTWIPTQNQPDKLSPRGAEGRLVGYVDGSSSMYQVMYTITEWLQYLPVALRVTLTSFNCLICKMRVRHRHADSCGKTVIYFGACTYVEIWCID